MEGLKGSKVFKLDLAPLDINDLEKMRNISAAYQYVWNLLTSLPEKAFEEETKIGEEVGEFIRTKRLAYFERAGMLNSLNSVTSGSGEETKPGEDRLMVYGPTST